MSDPVTIGSVFMAKYSSTTTYTPIGHMYHVDEVQFVSRKLGW